MTFEEGEEKTNPQFDIHNDTSLPEIFNDLEADKKEKIRNWIEKGDKNETAVAVYGTSLQKLKEMLINNRLSSVPDDQMNLKYQQEIRENGNKLYYAVPMPKRMTDSNPDLRDEIIAPFDEIGRPISDIDSKDKAAAYAQEMAIEDFYRQATNGGIARSSDMLKVLMDLGQNDDFIDNFISGNTHQDRATAEVNAKRTRVALMKHNNRGKESELRQTLKDSLSQRGVLIYLTDDIFSKAGVQIGEEDDLEILITPDKELPLDVIEGIELL